MRWWWRWLGRRGSWSGASVVGGLRDRETGRAEERCEDEASFHGVGPPFEQTGTHSEIMAAHALVSSNTHWTHASVAVPSCVSRVDAQVALPGSTHLQSSRATSAVWLDGVCVQAAANTTPSTIASFRTR